MVRNPYRPSGTSIVTLSGCITAAPRARAEHTGEFQGRPAGHRILVENLATADDHTNAGGQQAYRGDRFLARPSAFVPAAIRIAVLPGTNAAKYGPEAGGSEGVSTDMGHVEFTRKCW